MKMRIDYSPAKTFWCFDDISARVYPITVVAETEKCLYLAPPLEYNHRGYKIPPILRQKRALPTFHSFQEAKNQLIEELQGRLTATKDRAFDRCNRYQELLDKACLLEVPDAN
jgi:hypothetical protein